jgi:hypothetical protein
MTKKILTTAGSMLLLIASFSSYAQVGINNTTPDASAELDVKSTTRGFLAPRMTTIQMNAISSPATGLAVFNSDSSTYCVYTGTGWVRLVSSTSLSTLTLTSGYFPYWTGSNFENSSLYYPHNNLVSLGTTTAYFGGDFNYSHFIMAANSTDSSDFSNIVATNDNYGAWFNWGKARGTIAAPTSVQDEDELFSLNINAHDGNRYIRQASIRVRASGTIAVNKIPTAIGITSTDTTGASVERFSINNLGYVGISNVSPESALDVAGTTRTTGLQVTTGAASGYILQSDASGNGSWVSPTTLVNGNWTTSGSNQYSAVSGNVGIGTNTISTKLHVYTTGAGNTILSQSGTHNAYLAAASTAGTEASTLYQTYTGSSFVNRWAAGKTNDAESGSNLGSDYFMNRYDDAGSFLSQPVRISRSTGYIGFNTSTPKSQLEINGAVAMKVKTAQVAGTNDPDGTGEVWFYSSGTGTISFPAAGTCNNRMYTIINQTGATRTTSSYKDLTGTAQTTLANSTSISVISDGTNWLQFK